MAVGGINGSSSVLAVGAEPVTVWVVRPNGDLVFPLSVNPRKQIVTLKVQIEGLQDLPTSTQLLRLNDNLGPVLDDDSTFEELGICGEVTVVLDLRSPLFSTGTDITPKELRRLLMDPEALDNALDAYKDNPQYSTAELETIVASLSLSLLGKRSSAPSSAKLSRRRKSLASKAMGALNGLRSRVSTGSSGGSVDRTALRANFKTALRDALVALERELADGDVTSQAASQFSTAPNEVIVGLNGRTDASPPEVIQDWFGLGTDAFVASSTAAAADVASASAHADAQVADVQVAAVRPEVVVENEHIDTGPAAPKRTVRAIDVPVQAEDDGPREWHGANKELRQHFHRRWSRIHPGLEGSKIGDDSEIDDSGGAADNACATADCSGK